MKQWLAGFLWMLLFLGGCGSHVSALTTEVDDSRLSASFVASYDEASGKLSVAAFFVDPGRAVNVVLPAGGELKVHGRPLVFPYRADWPFAYSHGPAKKVVFEWKKKNGRSDHYTVVLPLPVSFVGGAAEIRQKRTKDLKLPVVLEPRDDAKDLRLTMETPGSRRRFPRPVDPKAITLTKTDFESHSLVQVSLRRVHQQILPDPRTIPHVELLSQFGGRPKVIRLED